MKGSVGTQTRLVGKRQYNPRVKALIALKLAWATIKDKDTSKKAKFQARHIMNKNQAILKDLDSKGMYKPKNMRYQEELAFQKRRQDYVDNFNN